jgi:hypothetical protein
MDLIRACLRVAAEHLAGDGCLLLQVAGARQGEHVEQLLLARPQWGLCAGELRTVDTERAILRINRA